MGNEIVLEKKNGWSDKEYYCDITRLLDHCSGLKNIQSILKIISMTPEIYGTRRHWQSVFRGEQRGALK